MKEKLVVLKFNTHRNKKFIEVDGKTYVMDKVKTQNVGRVKKEETVLTFKKFDIKEYESIINEAAEKIAKKTDVKEIIKQALYELPAEIIEKISNEMKKVKPKIRNRKGCAYLTIGKNKLYIRD